MFTVVNDKQREDAHADITRDGTGEVDRLEGLSGCPDDGRILPDAHGPALHRADRDALSVGASPGGKLP